MGELTRVKDQIKLIIENEIYIDDDNFFEFVEDEICNSGICGNLNCDFCPLVEQNVFYEQYGEIINGYRV